VVIFPLLFFGFPTNAGTFAKDPCMSEVHLSVTAKNGMMISSLAPTHVSLESLAKHAFTCGKRTLYIKLKHVYKLLRQCEFLNVWVLFEKTAFPCNTCMHAFFLHCVDVIFAFFKDDWIFFLFLIINSSASFSRIQYIGSPSVCILLTNRCSGNLWFYLF